MIKCFVLCIYCSTVNVLAFNINTNNPIIFREPKKNGSHFGYSTSFHFNSKDTSNVLITAPKGNSAWTSSGVLYKCDFRTQKCTEVVLERHGLNNTRIDSESNIRYEIDGGRDMWLGVSLDTQTKAPFDTVVCGHRWMSPNSNYARFEKWYSMVGVCYQIPSETVMAKRSSPQINIQKLIPFYNYAPIVFYPKSREILGSSIGLAGVSVRFDEDTRDLYIGAPGLFEWIGGVVLYKNRKGSSSLRNPMAFIPEETNYNVYAGYSIATGHFFKNNESPSVVLGAPKAAKGYGKVYVSLLFDRGYRRVQHLESEYTLMGDQLGSNFGASLLAMKRSDRDDFHILIVGAPLFSSQQGGDEGRVSVYISDGTSLLRRTILKGKQIANARFGYALACIGDVNLDGFNDLAVGAPYENDHGAVYIYHGLQEGVTKDYVQRIEGSKFNKDAKGFGISIARGMDIDSNHYPDLLIGSYASDSAFLLRTHPILELRGFIDVSVRQINRDMDRKCKVKGKSVICFNITNCVIASGKHVPEHTNILLTMRVDARNELDRGVFSIDNHLKNTTRELFVAREKSQCVDLNVYVIESDTQDYYLTPVNLEMTITLKDPVQEGMGEFCSHCPKVDLNSPSLITREIPFAKDCGSDNVCSSDLFIKLRLSGNERSVVLGQNRSVDVIVTVENAGEPAFLSKMTLVIPKNTRLLRFPKGCTNFENNAIDGKYDIQQLLECNVGNPLGKDKAEEITVLLDVSPLPNTQNVLAIDASVATTSHEISPEDCTTNLNVKLEALASVDILGYPETPLTIFVGYESLLPVNHAYDVRKIGPTAVNRVKVTLLIPYADLTSSTVFAIIESVEVRRANGGIMGFCDYYKDKMSNTSLLTGNQDWQNDTFLDRDSYSERSDGNFDINSTTEELNRNPNPATTSIDREAQALGKELKMNCDSVKCLTVTCFVGPFQRDGDATTIGIKARLNMTALNTLYGLTLNMMYTSKGSVEIIDEITDSFASLNTTQYGQTTMSLVFKAPPPSVPLPKWIIAVSAGAGFLLVGLIAVGLLKFGFFRRKQHEEMKRLLQQASIIKEENHHEQMNEAVIQENDELYGQTHYQD